MATILVLKHGEQGGTELESAVRAAYPFLHTVQACSASEFRYTLLCKRPTAVVLPADSEAAPGLAWEVRALHPATKIIVLCSCASQRRLWDAFSESDVCFADREEAIAALREVWGATVHRSDVRPGVGEGFILLDEHRMKNRLAGLYAGLHAMAAELSGSAAQSDRIGAVADEYVDRLMEVIGEMCAMLAAGEARSCDEQEV